MARRAIEVDGTAESPESNRLADFRHPRHTENLFGHDQAWHRFVDVVESRRMHHAWLLTGTSGIGKATFAYRAARLLLEAGEDDGTDGVQTARLINAGSHPRLFVIRRPYDPKTKKFATTIPVDEVRRLRPFVGKTAGARSWRVVIIDDANDLNTASANALLKVLEEPPRQTVFFLVAPQPGALLATIRSRCRTLAFAPLSGGDFAHAAHQALAASELPARSELSLNELEHLEKISGGSVGRALMLAGPDGQSLINTVESFFQALPKVDWRRLRSFADEVGGPGQDQQFELATDLIFHRIAAVTKAGISGDGAAEDIVMAGRIIAPGAVASWARLWERGVRARAEVLGLNLDRKSMLFSLFSGLAAAAQEHGSGTGPS